MSSISSSSRRTTYLLQMNMISPQCRNQLLFTVIDALEAVTNDIDLMTGISTEFSDIGQAYQFLEARIQQVKDKIAAIPEPEEDYSCFSLMYTREPVPKHRYKVVDNKTIDDMLKEEFGV